MSMATQSSDDYDTSSTTTTASSSLHFRGMVIYVHESYNGYTNLTPFLTVADEVLAEERRQIHRAWIRFVCPPNNEPNPLRVLTRATNSLWLWIRNIRQPCWRTGRWKSKT